MGRTDNTKRDQVKNYLISVKKGNQIPFTQKYVMKATKSTQYLVKSEADRMNLRFLDGRGQHFKSSEDRLQEIEGLLEKDSSITYKEIAQKLGVSKQRAHQIVSHYRLQKQKAGMRKASRQRVERMIMYYQSNPPERDIKTALTRFKVNYHTYQKYLELYGKDKNVRHFLRIHSKEKTKAARIRRYLNTTEYPVSKIARLCKVNPSYVSKIRKEMSVKKAKIVSIDPKRA